MARGEGRTQAIGEDRTDDAPPSASISVTARAWASEQQRVLCEIDDGVMLSLQLLAGREQHAVIDDLIAQLRTIGALLRGGPAPPARHQGVVFVSTLEDAARSAASLSGAGTVSNHPTLRVTIPRFTREQRWLRGLYASGALAWEAVTLLGASLRTASNLREGGAFFGALNDPTHLVVDLGDEAPSEGHGHPRLDLTTRLAAIRSVANDPTSMVLLLDVPLGAGAHDAPGAALGAAIREARAQVAARGGTLVVVASVTGTDGDPQVQSRQIGALVAAGAEVCSSNAAAVRRARSVAVGEWL